MSFVSVLPTGLDSLAILAGFQLAFYLALAIASPVAAWSLMRKLTS